MKRGFTHCSSKMDAWYGIGGFGAVGVRVEGATYHVRYGARVRTAAVVRRDV